MSSAFSGESWPASASNLIIDDADNQQALQVIANLID
jgi:hypothetical protein